MKNNGCSGFNKKLDLFLEKCNQTTDWKAVKHIMHHKVRTNETVEGIYHKMNNEILKQHRRSTCHFIKRRKCKGRPITDVPRNLNHVAPDCFIKLE